MYVCMYVCKWEVQVMSVMDSVTNQMPTSLLVCSFCVEGWLAAVTAGSSLAGGEEEGVWVGGWMDG